MGRSASKFRWSLDVGRHGAGVALALLALAGMAAPAQAQEPAGAWTFDLGVYGWITGMSGEAGAQDLTVELDASFSDIVDKLEIGGMFGFAATHGRWVLLSDLVVASLGARQEAQGVKFEVDVDMLIVDAELGYEVGHGVHLFAGARRFDLDTLLTRAAGALERTAVGGEAWTDPVVGARWGVPVGERGSFSLRGDVGGFGVGSDLSWNARAAFGYRVGRNATLAAGYHALDVDYDHGSGRNRFRLDLLISGPEVGAIFRF